MYEILKEFPNHHEFFIYTAGGGGEEFVYLIGNLSEEYYKYKKRTIHKINRTRIDNNPWMGWLNGNQENRNYDSIESFFNNFINGPDLQSAELRNDLLSGKHLLSFGHSVPEILLNFMPDANFIFQSYPSIDERVYAEYLAFLKLHTSSMNLSEICKEIHHSGKSKSDINETFLHHVPFLTALCNDRQNETKSIPGFIFEKFFWEADKKFIDKAHTEFYSNPSRFFNNFLKEELINIVFDRINAVKYDYNSREEKMKNKYSNITFFPLSNMFDGYKVQQILRKKIDVEMFSERIKNWHDRNLDLMKTFEVENTIEISSKYNFSFCNI